MPRVSILIPSYGHERYLAQALRSVAEQTFPDWDCWILDDQSPDRSHEIASQFSVTDPRFHALKNPQNLGTYGTLQRALELSESEFVAVLNSDDWWRPEKLALQVGMLTEHTTASCCYVLGSMMDQAGETELNGFLHEGWPDSALQDLLPFLLYENRILASGVVFRRKGLRFEASLRYSGDWVALLEAAVRGPIACVSEPLTYWRQHETNSYVRSERQLFEEIRVREAIEFHRDHWLKICPQSFGALRQNAHALFHLVGPLGLVEPARRVARWLPGPQGWVKRLASWGPPGLLRAVASRGLAGDWLKHSVSWAQDLYRQNGPGPLRVS